MSNTNGEPTAKQVAVLRELSKFPDLVTGPIFAKRSSAGRARGELVRKVAATAGVSYEYFIHILSIERARRIGEAIRAEELKSKMLPPALPWEGMSLGPVREFTSWVDTFGRLRLVADAYRTLALERGDVYASSYMEEITSLCARAQRRASMSQLG